MFLPLKDTVHGGILSQCISLLLDTIHIFSVSHNTCNEDLFHNWIGPKSNKMFSEVFAVF